MENRRKKVADSKTIQDLNNNDLKDKSSVNVYHEAGVYRRYGLNRFLGEVIVPLFLLTIIPILTLTIWYVCVKCNGDLIHFYNTVRNLPTLYDVLYEIILQRLIVTKFAILTVGSFFVWAILMTILLPGENYNGSVTIKGNVPQYKDNGLLYHFVTTLAFFIFAAALELYTPYSVAIVYDKYDEIIVACNVIGFLFCWFLYFKGIFFPSSSDNSTTGNIIFDYYWGTELHPRIFGIDVKLITNCRFGMAVWHLVGIIFCWKSFKVNGFVDSIFISALLTSIYLTKFFHWESGYTKTIDIALDRAGYMICYGCICWVPSFYTLPTMYLVNNPIRLGPVLASIILICGLLSIYINYDADHQKQIVRATNGKCNVWGKKPKLIEAKCQLLDGTKSTSLLLVSGYWAISRHFHYIPEILLAFFWSVPALFESIVPYFYVIFLIILLSHRSIRDDNKCSKKYGKYWIEYKKQVPYKIIPYIF